MPRNYRNIDRDERVGRLLTIAADQFLTVGYKGTTMAQIARLAGLTNAAVYWYFPSKDDALVAVQRRVLVTIRERLNAEPGLTPMLRLVRYLEIARSEARPLHRMLHERAAHSPAVAEVLDEIHQEIAEMIRSAVLARSDRYPHVSQMVELSIAVIEGTSAVTAEAHSSELVRWAIENLVPLENDGPAPTSPRSSRPIRNASGREAARES